ncbi:virulence factor [Mucisphaera sp.]|uniref:virulence factor n=1 Tax=Mucisphaera sp. TaxID=2913024 RepID=UPI003D0D5C53
MLSAIESLQTQVAQEQASKRPLPEGCVTVYAIAFDMDTLALEETYGQQDWRRAYRDIADVLEGYGFSWTQHSVYFGGESVNAVTCVMVAIELARRFSWFEASVRDIRMLRIEELNDLGPAVRNAGRAPDLFDGR